MADRLVILRDGEPVAVPLSNSYPERGLIGEIKLWVGVTEPVGFRFCDGGIVSGLSSGDDYEEIVSLMGGAFGVLDGTLFGFVNGSDTVTDTTGVGNRYAIGNIIFVNTAATPVFSEISSTSFVQMRYAPLYVVARPTSTTYKLALTAGGTPLVSDFTRNENVFKAFSFPDLRGRVPVGLNNMGGSSTERLSSHSEAGNIMGGSGGADTHLLTSAQSGLPSHVHFVGGGQNTVARTNTGANTAGVGGGNSSANTAANASQAHNNLQPFQIVSYIIRYR